MPRFYFHMSSGEEFIEDPEGSDLPDLAAARAEAIDAARELMADRVRTGHPADGQEFLIFDAEGNQLDIIPFRSVLRLD
jgi:hypothetical protein